MPNASADRAPPLPPGTRWPSVEHWKRLDRYLDELLDLPGPARSARLDALRRAEDSADLVDELQALLAGDESARGIAFLTGQPRAEPDGADPTLAGQVVGAYALEAPLGEGGSGTVWRARRIDGRVDGQAAVKLLHLSLLGHSAAERFRREGAILARLSHPNIAGLLDAGLTATQQPYLVIELIDGEPIDVYCDRRQLGIEARLRLFLDVLAAVGHAHRHLVVHRDIKPANVLVTHDGCVKLLDFGIAKLIEDGGRPADATALTREVGRAMTLSHAAPEQFLGAAVTTATDVYALGVLLYQLLAGRHPLLRPGTPAHAVMRAVVEAEPQRLSRPDDDARMAAQIASSRGLVAPRLARRLAGDLDNITAHALRKRPSERYPTVDALGSDIRRHLENLPISVRADAWRYRAGKFVRRHQSTVAAAALAILALAGGVASTLIQAQRTGAQAELARLARDEAVSALRDVELANEFIGNVLTEGSRRPLSSVGLIDQADALLDGQFATLPATRSRLQVMLATMYAEMGQQQRALAMLDKAAAAADRAARQGAPLQPGAQARIACLRAFHRQQVEGIDAALAVLDRRRGDDSDLLEDTVRARATCLTRRSVLRKRGGHLADAEADARNAQQVLAGLAAGPQVPMIEARRELASAIGNQGRNADAVAEWRRLLADLQALGRGRSVYAAHALNNLGTRLYGAGQNLEAMAAQLQSIAIWEGLEGADRVDVQLLANLATDLDLLGRRDESDRMLARAMARVGPQTSHEHLVHVTGTAAIIACREHRRADCDTMIDRLERQVPRDLQPLHNDRVLIHYVKAERAAMQGDAGTQREHLMAMVQIATQGQVRNTLLASAWRRLSALERSLGQGAEALAAADRSLASARVLSKGFDHSSLIGMALLARGHALRLLGQAQQAHETFETALAHLEPTMGPDAPVTAEARRALADGPGAPQAVARR